MGGFGGVLNIQQKSSLIGGQETIDRSDSVRLNCSAANLDE
jgi:hypothetical protein